MNSFQVRRAELEDTPRILQIADKYSFTLPNTYCTAHVVARESGSVCAFGLLRPILEAIIVTSGTPREIVEQTDLLLGQGLRDVKDLGHDQIHCFVETASFARLLKNKYGFKTPVGDPLVLVLE